MVFFIIPNVSIIILNLNGWKDTIECLESLYQNEYSNYNVIVVDNGSEDESIKKIKEYCKGKIRIESNFFNFTGINKPIRIIEYSKDEIEKGEVNENDFRDLISDRILILIKNHINYGFTGGNNIAIKFSLENLNPEYILLLNNDTVVTNSFLNNMIQISKDNKIGIIYPTVYDYHDRRKIQSPAHISSLKELRHQNYIKKDYNEVWGMCFLVKKKVFKEIGLLNEKYFLYQDEIEFQYRVFRGGYKLAYVPSSIIYHKGNVKNIHENQIYYGTRNNCYFIKKNLGYKNFLKCIFMTLGVIFKDITNMRLNIAKIKIKGLLDGCISNMGKKH